MHVGYEADGATDGAAEGAVDGAAVGATLGAVDDAGALGATDGATEGATDGTIVGAGVGEEVQAAKAVNIESDRVTAAIARFIWILRGESGHLYWPSN